MIIDCPWLYQNIKKMSTVNFDVVIIGLGPTGGTLANLLAMNNLSIQFRKRSKYIQPTTSSSF